MLKNEYTPSVMRTNARFRGHTEIDKYSNFVNETFHDLKLIDNIFNGNDLVAGKEQGQSTHITANAISYMNGSPNFSPYCNIPTSTSINGSKKKMEDILDLMNNKWIPYGGCTKSIDGEGILLESPGTSDPCGVSTSIDVEPGDIVLIRMAVQNVEGNTDDFALGSATINQGQNDYETFKISEDGTTIYAEKRLYCLYRESISINVNVHYQAQNLAPAKVKISDVDISYLSERSFNLMPINSGVKCQINELESKINNIINNM